MTARIPPVVAALAAALDAHEWRLAGRYNIEKGREVQRRAIAALNATTIAREEMLRETALQATEGSDAIASLAWLADKCHDRARDLRLTADGMRARRAAAYLRWCVRRLRAAARPRAAFALSPPPNEGETLGEYRARTGARSGSETHAARTVAWHNGHWETIRERGT